MRVILNEKDAVISHEGITFVIRDNFIHPPHRMVDLKRALSSCESSDREINFQYPAKDLLDAVHIAKGLIRAYFNLHRRGK